MRAGEGHELAPVRPVSRWRLLAAAGVLAVLIFISAAFAPIYFHSFQLKSYISSLPERIQAMSRSGKGPSDDAVKGWVENRARDLRLPVKAENVQLLRPAPGAPVARVSVPYKVTVELPGYSVDLHFHPQANR